MKQIIVEATVRSIDPGQGGFGRVKLNGFLEGTSFGGVDVEIAGLNDIDTMRSLGAVWYKSRAVRVTIELVESAAGEDVAPVEADDGLGEGVQK